MPIYTFYIIMVLPIIAAFEIESALLIILFFAFVSVCAAVGIFVILRENSYRIPASFIHIAMIILLLITMLVSAIFSISLYRIGSQLRYENSSEPQTELLKEEPFPGTNYSLSALHA